MKKIISSTALLLMLTGCNTIQGFGKDLQAVGGFLSESADTSTKGESRLKPAPDSYSYPSDKKRYYYN